VKTSKKILNKGSNLKNSYSFADMSAHTTGSCKLLQISVCLSHSSDLYQLRMS